MKRILAVGVLAAVVAATAQGQNSGLTAAGSNFTGPGGGGAGATGTIGAFLPTGRTGSAFLRTGLPATTGNVATTVRVGSVSVPIDGATRNALGSAVASSSPGAFVSMLTGVPTTQAQALGAALADLGPKVAAHVKQGVVSTRDIARSSLDAAITAYNNAVNALPTGSPVPTALVAARALLMQYAAMK